MTDTKISYEFTKQESNQMQNFFLQMGQGKMSKQAEKVSQLIFGQMKQISQQQVGIRSDKFLTIQVGCYQNMKESPECSQVFILGCLIFGLVKTRTLKISFQVNTRSNIKIKTNQKNIIMYVKNRKHIDLGRRFNEYLHNMLKIEKFQLKNKFNYFREFYIRCRSHSTQPNFMISSTMRILREGVYHFINQIYASITRMWEGQNIYIPRNTFSCFQLKDQPNPSQYKDIENIILQIRSFYTLDLILRNENLQLIRFLISQPKPQPPKQLFQDDSETYGRYNGFYCPFNGSSLQYIKVLKIYTCTINHPTSNLCLIKNVFKQMPHLQFFYLQKQGAQIILPQIDNILQSLIVYSTIIKAFVFKNISVTKVRSQILNTLLQECPFLVNLQLNINFRFQIEETYTFSSPEQKQIKQQERNCQTILKVMNMRAITFESNQDMIKLIQHEGFDFNTALQTIYCIQPVCY